MAQDIEHVKTPHGERAPACTLVIFGAAGDLTKRLLMPALYNLARTGLLPDNFALIGVDRADMSDESFRAHVAQAVTAFAADKHSRVGAGNRAGMASRGGGKTVRPRPGICA